MMNIGIWYNRFQQQDYARHLRTDYLPFLVAAATHDGKASNAVFLESTLQHWSSATGDFDARAARGPHKSPHCRALASDYSLSMEGDWRNYLVRQEISALPDAGRLLTLLPVAEAMAVGGERLHMASSDCTHLCYFPTLFQFKWHALQLIAEQNCVGRRCVQADSLT